VLLFLLGCTGDRATGEGPRVAVDTVNGIERVRNLDSGEGQTRLSWTVDTAGVRIGVVEGEEEYVFGNVNGVAVGLDRRIYVADGQALEIRVFSPEGRFEFRFGRAGEGPGEFRSVDGVRVDPQGRVIVRDPVLLRLSLFSPAGEFEKSFRLQRPYIQLSGRGTLWVDGQGRIYDETDLGRSGDVDSTGVISYAEDGEVLDTALVRIGVAPLMLIRRDGVPHGGIPVPFSPTLQLEVDRAGNIIAGLGGEYRIAVVTAAGDTTRLVTREVAERPLPSWIDDTVQARIEWLKQWAGGGEVDAFDLPRHQPYFTSLVVDALGYWWVGREGNPRVSSGEYDVFAPSGEYLGTVQVPRIFIYEIGEDFIAGMATDSLGVARAVVLGLTRE
jgi:sugar lactone lactonase YvrE